jgi:hypothetical protein
MSSGGGGGGGNTTTTTELPSWAQPYAQDLLQRGSDLSNTTVPQYTGQTVAGMNDAQNAAISNATANATTAQNTAGNAANWAMGVTHSSGPQVSNPYTGNITASTAADMYANPANNPYLAQSVNAANQQITDAYQNVTAPTTLAQFRNAGAFGGSAQEQATAQQEKQLATALGNNTANMYNSAYNTGAGVAAQNAAQQNAVNMSNQAIGTNANNAYNAQRSANYFNNVGAGATALNAATNANNQSGTATTQQMQAGNTQQQNQQNALNAAYEQWYNNVNQPYAQLSTLSRALSGALGSGTGTSVSQYNPGTSNTLGTALGLGQLGLGIYGAMQ